MNELLQNPEVLIPVLVVLVKLIDLLVQFVRAKWPTQTQVVEDYWCYLQPVVGDALAKAQGAKTDGTLSESVAYKITAKAVVDFVDSFSKFERKSPNATIITAVRAEIDAALAKVAK